LTTTVGSVRYTLIKSRRDPPRQGRCAWVDFWAS
jgi:hypothetical protein